MGRMGVFGLLLMVGVVLLATAVVTALPAPRTTMVERGDPVRVISWDQARRRLTVMLLPEDAYLVGASGAGNLPIASLQRLEILDESKKGVFIRSLSDALAIPIVGEKDDLALPIRIRLWWIMRALRPDAVDTLDLPSLGVFRTETLPDGTSIRMFDESRFDAVIAGQLEVDSIRLEERRVRVVNTTTTPGLGSLAARFLSRAGMVVVAVDTESGNQETCTVHTKEHFRRDQSVRYIKDVFGCALTAVDAEERADFTVRLGTAFAKR